MGFRRILMTNEQEEDIREVLNLIKILKATPREAEEGFADSKSSIF
jgi:hypothetical protein